VTGFDGNLWFQDNTKIGKMTLTGTVTEYTVPYTVRYIAAGPDGNIWFTTDTNVIGRMSMTGTGITAFTTPDNLSFYGITAGPDGNLWAAATPGRLVRITP
jgi:virginiamycin B lyase